MVHALDIAEHASMDEPEEEVVIVDEQMTGERGRPKLVIHEDFLRDAIKIHTWAELGCRFGCNPRTVRRRAIELGLVEPCPPVRQLHIDENGHEYETITSYTPAMADLTEEEIDSILRQIYDVFPSFGREMIRAQFRLYGFRVSRERIRAAQERVIGPPPLFGCRRIERRVYHVAGPNALWHNDGWHGKSENSPESLATRILCSWQG